MIAALRISLLALAVALVAAAFGMMAWGGPPVPDAIIAQERPTATPVPAEEGASGATDYDCQEYLTGPTALYYGQTTATFTIGFAGDCSRQTGGWVTSACWTGARGTSSVSRRRLPATQAIRG